MMIRSCIIRLRKDFFNTSSKRTFIMRNKEFKATFRLLSTESALPLHTGNDKSKAREDDPKFSSLLHTLNKVGMNFNNNNIKDIVDNNSVLFRIDDNQILQNSSTLLEFGFERDTVKNIIKVHPELFRINNNELSRLLNSWQEVNFGEKRLLEILSNHPQLINCMGPNVLERISFLLPYLKTLNNVAYLLINVPGVLYENWETLEPKLKYLHSHLIPRNKIANCNALELSLHEMKTRFAFLERAGLYKMPDPRKQKIHFKNAAVRSILCTSDQVFAENVARLTLVEYEAFVELYKLELDDDDDDDEFTIDSEYDSE